MPTTYNRFVAHFPMDSGVPEDQAVNVWHFRVDDLGTQTPYNQIAIALTTFYTSITNYLSNWIKKDGLSFAVFDLGQPRPRLPKYEIPFQIPEAPTSAWQIAPPELSVALSYGAALASGDPKGRKRGRMYIGPLNYVANLNASLSYVPTATVQALADAGAALLAASNTASDWKWCVHSRYHFGGLSVGEDPPPGVAFPENPEYLASSFSPVTHGWVDNAWDVQRRRGLDASTRVSFGLAQAKFQQEPITVTQNAHSGFTLGADETAPPQGGPS